VEGDRKGNRRRDNLPSKFIGRREREMSLIPGSLSVLHLWLVFLSSFRLPSQCRVANQRWLSDILSPDYEVEG